MKEVDLEVTLTLRDALKALKRPYRTNEVKKLRQRILLKEKKSGESYLIKEPPYRIKLSDLWKLEPELFVDMDLVLKKSAEMLRKIAARAAR